MNIISSDFKLRSSGTLGRCLRGGTTTHFCQSVPRSGPESSPRDQSAVRRTVNMAQFKKRRKWTKLSSKLRNTYRITQLSGLVFVDGRDCIRPLLGGSFLRRHQLYHSWRRGKIVGDGSGMEVTGLYLDDGVNESRMKDPRILYLRAVLTLVRRLASRAYLLQM